MKKVTSVALVLAAVALSTTTEFAFSQPGRLGKGFLKSGLQEGHMSIPVDVDACLENFKAVKYGASYCEYRLSTAIPDLVEHELAKEGKSLDLFELVRIGSDGRMLDRWVVGAGGLFRFTRGHDEKSR